MQIWFLCLVTLFNLPLQQEGSFDVWQFAFHWPFFGSTAKTLTSSYQIASLEKILKLSNERNCVNNSYIRGRMINCPDKRLYWKRILSVARSKPRKAGLLYIVFYCIKKNVIRNFPLWFAWFFVNESLEKPTLVFTLT